MDQTPLLGPMLGRSACNMGPHYSSLRWSVIVTIAELSDRVLHTATKNGVQAGAYGEVHDIHE